MHPDRWCKEDITVRSRRVALPLKLGYTEKQNTVEFLAVSQQGENNANHPGAAQRGHLLCCFAG